MKRVLGIVASMLVAGIVMAEEMPANYNFSGNVNFDKGCVWKLNGTPITATATMINNLSSNVTNNPNSVVATSNLTVTGTVSISGALTNTGTIVGSGLVTEYSYAAAVGASASQVIMTQYGTNNMVGNTQTNTFPVTFIGTPVVFTQNPTGVSTNVMAIATNAFTTAGTAANGNWMAVGRVK